MKKKKKKIYIYIYNNKMIANTKIRWVKKTRYLLKESPYYLNIWTQETAVNRLM